jgi:S-DNA-T family DNA segregation ATPase FtsK/SpoIIIE
VLDFASRGLLALRDLPSVIDVATGDDLEAVSRHLLQLDRELTRRRRLLSAVGAEHLTAYHVAVGADGGPALDRIVVLIDGFDGLAATLLEGAGSLAASDTWADIVHRIVVEGRQVGIHAVLTAGRRAAVPARLQAAIGPRLVLRHADPSGYADHGVDATRATALEPGAGRALLGTGVVQIACVAREHTARAQADAVAAMARTSRRFPATALHSAPLPDRLDRHEIAADPVVRAAVIGRVDVTGEPAVVDLAWSHAAVVGPPRSGRSSALAAFVEGLGGLVDVRVVGPASSPLARAPLPDACFGRPEVLAPFLARLVEHVDERTADPIVLVVDDADALDDTLLQLVWERLAASDGVRIVAALDQRAMSGYSASPLVALARRARRQLVLQPDDPAELLQTTGVRMPSRPGLRFPPGRGVLVVDREATVVQVALPTPTVPPSPARPDGPPVTAP